MKSGAAFLLLIVFLTFTVFADEEEFASEEAPASTVETSVAEVVVAAYDNFCKPEVLDEKLVASSSVGGSKIEIPGFKNTWESVTNNPNSFEAERETGFVSLDAADSKMTLQVRHFSCQDEEACKSLISKYPNLNFSRYVEHGFENYKWQLYSVAGEVSYDQVYNAHHEDVDVACPLATCTGISLESSNGRIFYTATKIGGVIERKLIVHGTRNSKFVDGPGDEIDSCEDK